MPWGVIFLSTLPPQKLTVNLVFDERQHATRVKQRLLSRLQQTEALHASLANLTTPGLFLYQDKLRAYEMARTAYEARVEAYNAHVQQWNARGGPPVQAQQTLAVERTQIEAPVKNSSLQTGGELRDIIETLKALKDRDKTLAATYTRQVHCECPAWRTPPVS